MPHLGRYSYRTQMLLLMAVYIGLLLLLWPQARHTDVLALKAVFALVPLLPMIGAIWLIARRIMCGDELVQPYVAPRMRGHRVAGGAIDPEQNELIARQQRENRQALREDGEHANAQSKMRGPGTHERKGEGVLAEHDPVNHIERQSGEKSQRQAARARRFDAPIENHQHQKVRTKGIQHRGQRHDGEGEGSGRR